MDEVTSKLAHDLRQPLAAMKTWSELLASTMGAGTDEKPLRYLSKIQGEIGRMASMLDEFSAKQAGVSAK